MCFLYEFEATLDESHCPAFGTFKLQLVIHPIIKFRSTMSVLHLSTTLRAEYIYSCYYIFGKPKKFVTFAGVMAICCLVVREVVPPSAGGRSHGVPFRFCLSKK